MWWWMKKKEEYIETDEEKEKKKVLNDAKNKVYNEIIIAIKNEDVELAKKWMDFYDVFSKYKYNYK